MAEAKESKAKAEPFDGKPKGQRVGPTPKLVVRYSPDNGERREVLPDSYEGVHWDEARRSKFKKGDEK